jgi:hypothetical protein
VFFSLPRDEDFCGALSLPSQQALLEGDAKAYRRILQGIATVNPDDAPSSDSGELPLFRCQGLRAGEIQLNDTALTDRRSHGDTNECACPADIRTVTVEETACVRQPYAHRPRQIRPLFPTLLYQRIHRLGLLSAHVILCIIVSTS